MGLGLRRRLEGAKRRLSDHLRSSAIGSANGDRQQQEIDSLYRLLHALTHDWDHSLDLTTAQTRQAFATQWEELPEGAYLLTDPWFRENVGRILCEEELQIRPEWFKGRTVLDAGCGNGRWSYGLASLGADVVSVDVNAVAVEKAREAVSEFGSQVKFVVSPLEELSQALPSQTFDLVFSWGVIHHCGSFTGALRQLASKVSEEGVLFVYVYGSEGTTPEIELEIFKDRIRFNLMESPEEKRQFLLEKAGGREDLVHGYHDAYAPLVNRRFTVDEMIELVSGLGFEDVSPTIRSPGGVWIRAIRSDAAAFLDRWGLPPKQPPFWFQHHPGTGGG
jgi:2-polyprenyl-3-methyl-5-hydroxy-6-metoxy-1,4-benzoquinol methylase